jgi:cell division GTPase FtsZ
MKTANKILIIGVGSAGVIAADKMNLPNSKKLFIDTSSQTFREVKSEGDKLVLQCKDYGACSGFCHCYSQPGFCKKVAEDYEDEIRECIKNAFNL